jgi:hypothetical protein
VIRLTAGTLAVAATAAGTLDLDRPAGATVAVGATITGDPTVDRAATGTRPVAVTVTGTATTIGSALRVAISPIHGTGALDDLTDAPGYNAGAQTLTITGTASGVITVDRVDIVVDGGTPITATGTTSWYLTIDVSGWGPGPHTITATAYEGAAVSAPAPASVWMPSVGRTYGAAAVAGGHLVPVTFSGCP